MQFDLSDFRQKDIIVLGKSKETDVFEAFIQKYATIRSFLCIEEIDASVVAQKLSSVDMEQTIIVKSAEFPARLLNIPYTTPTNIFFRCVQQLGAHAVGITGTWGKSTTTALLGHMFHQGGAQVLVSREGEALPLELLEQANEQSFFVVELSSQMLEGVAYAPSIVVMTTLDREHVQFHGTLEAYWNVYKQLLSQMNETQLFIYDPTNEVVLHWLAEHKVRATAIDPMEQVDMTQSNLIGDFNKCNYLMARAAATAVGLDRITCQNALRSFQPLPHRMQRVRTVSGVTFIDDAESKSPRITNEEIMACVRQAGPVGCVMLGGKIDNIEQFHTLLRTCATLLIPKIVLFPPLTQEDITPVLSERYNPEIFVVDNMVKAVNWAGSHTPSGSICLLSTAGDTRNLWPHADEKGNQFQYAVNSLSN